MRIIISERKLNLLIENDDKIPPKGYYYDNNGKLKKIPKGAIIVNDKEDGNYKRNQIEWMVYLDAFNLPKKYNIKWVDDESEYDRIGKVVKNDVRFSWKLNPETHEWATAKFYINYMKGSGYYEPNFPPYLKKMESFIKTTASKYNIKPIGLYTRDVPLVFYEKPKKLYIYVPKTPPPITPVLNTTPVKQVGDPIKPSAPAVITNFVVQWQENGKQKIKFFPSYNEWNDFVNSKSYPYISKSVNNAKTEAGITYSSNPGLTADGSYVLGNKIYSY
jgi:hypothetical protein